MNRDKCKRALFLCVKYLVSAAVVAVVVGPLLVTLFTSVKTQAQLASTSPILPPAPGAWNWDNYAEVLGAKLLPVAVKNTAVILVVSIFFNVLLGSVTAYCLQRFEFRFRRLVMGCFYLACWCPPLWSRSPASRSSRAWGCTTRWARPSSSMWRPT